MVPLFAVVGRQRGGRCETLTGMTVQRAGELSDDLSCVLHRPQNWPSGSRCQLDQFWAESETVSLSLTHLACCKDVTASPSNPSSQHRVYPLPRCTKKGQSENIFLAQWIEKEHEHPICSADLIFFIISSHLIILRLVRALMGSWPSGLEEMPCGRPALLAKTALFGFVDSTYDKFLNGKINSSLKHWSC